MGAGPVNAYGEGRLPPHLAKYRDAAKEAAERERREKLAKEQEEKFRVQKEHAGEKAQLRIQLEEDHRHVITGIYERHRDEVRRTGQIWFGLGMLAGTLLATAVWVILFRVVDPPPVWHNITEERPRPLKDPVVVTTHKGWTKAFLDYQGDFRSYDNGEIVRGAYYWYELPERP